LRGFFRYSNAGKCAHGSSVLLRHHKQCLILAIVREVIPLHINRLSLTNFRNYLELEFDLPQSTSVFWGANAQGKTNLLESICFLATTRFSHSIPDKEIINWNALREKIPLARLSTEIQKEIRNTQVEIIIRPRSLSAREDGAVGATLHKHIQVNGVGRRSADLMGQLNMVMFSPRDIDLISDEPALRRRHLDITNSQVDSQYLRSLQRYNKVLSQRNHLLRQIAAGHSRPDELTFWDNELVKAGSYIVTQRQETIDKLEEMAGPIHHQLSAGEEDLSLNYVRSIDGGSSGVTGAEEVEKVFRETLSASREKDLARGQSLIGPHRDDVQFFINGINIGHYGSRGQQRTVALSLKLAEARFMLMRTGEKPVLLLDDVLSELDIRRREHLLETISDYQQVLITTTDLDRFPADFLDHAERFEVKNGTIL